MKSPKGFRGKYFSLAAILALNATITLASTVQSVVDTQEQLQTPRENATSEEETLVSELALPVMVVSKKIKEQKSEVYTASKSLVIATNVSDNVSIITSEELSQKGITTVTEALNTLPGVSITSNGGLGATKSVFLQGMANKYTLLMVDGVRYNDLYSISGADFSHLLIGNIERIEVIKGSQSGVWGSDAAAGVINIITKNAQKGTHGSAGFDMGSYGHTSGSVSFSHKTNQFDVMLSIQRTVEDGFSSQVPWGKDSDNYEDDAYRNTTVNTKMGYWIDERNRIEVGYHDINALNHYDAYMAPNSTQRSDTRQRSGYVIYKYYVENHALETILSQNSVNKKELDALSGVKAYEGKTPSVEVKDTWKYLNNGTVVVGGTYEKRELDYTQVGFNEKKYNENTNAFYVNNTNKLGNIVLTEALRYDAYSAFEDKITGKIGAKYHFSNDFNLYANYGTAYRTPAIFDMINLWGASNLDLKPENIQGFNIGMYYAGFNINLFRNEIEDLISWGGTRNVNIDGRSTLKGVEISYEQSLFRTLLAGANYTYVDAKDQNGNRLVNRPRYQSVLYATYIPIKQFALTVDGTYIGSRKDYSTNETGNYFVANSKVTYHVSKDLDVYVKINNLFDRYYQSVYGYASAERSYYAGFQARF